MDLALVRASEVQRGSIEWLWPSYIPMGALTLLAGDPGLGKSLLTCRLASDVTRGAIGAAAPCLISSAEDAFGAVVVPRLEAAGADLDKVHAVGGAVGADLLFPDHGKTLRNWVSDTGAKLVVIDPLSAHLARSINSWRDQSVRAALAPLREIAEEEGCAILIVAHLNKGQSDKALYRVGGSIGLPAAVRSALLLARDPKDPRGERGNRRILVHTKCNVAPEAPSLDARILAKKLAATEDVPEADTAILEIVGESDLQAPDVLAPTEGAPRRSDAELFLERALAEGPCQAKEIETLASEAGIAPATLKRAKTTLGVESIKEHGPHGRWRWQLPNVGAAAGSADTVETDELLDRLSAR